MKHRACRMSLPNSHRLLRSRSLFLVTSLLTITLTLTALISTSLLPFATLARPLFKRDNVNRTAVIRESGLRFPHSGPVMELVLCPVGTQSSLELWEWQDAGQASASAKPYRSYTVSGNPKFNLDPRLTNFENAEFCIGGSQCGFSVLFGNNLPLSEGGKLVGNVIIGTHERIGDAWYTSGVRTLTTFGMNCDTADSNHLCTSPASPVLAGSPVDQFKLGLTYQGVADQLAYNTFLWLLQAKSNETTGQAQSYEVWTLDPHTPTKKMYTFNNFKNSVYLYVKVGPFLDLHQTEVIQNNTSHHLMSLTIR
ncbi:hypothetical protein M427DRAFT_33216 [Gonapodya prolifera JEL478]|uniref:Uncharacterized protein n=1 Tax=Gonapodya prolifera (strain JEL478) TaxID=1344416 RepID=A0A139ABS1_GONPJ|nr:hypothetical protein M427DRAFT_33216 [Gonapodya prolifera JEL478]|eukprot:KXS14282.1 hypothetical protein M427DRAFT_33216 [Gonapodya prolifera JEL478]